MKTKLIVGAVIVLAIIIVGNFLLPVNRAAIEVAAEPIGLGPVTNSLLTSFIISAVLIIGAFVVGRSLKIQPTGLQNIVEFVLEILESFVYSLAPKKWAPTFFPILATIFIYLLFSNWFGLLTPLLGSIGLVHPAHGEGVPVDRVIFLSGSPESLKSEGHEGEEAAPAEGAEQMVTIVPLLRAPSSDLNLPVALAIISVLLTQVFGVLERGVAYFGNFIRLDAFSKKGLFMGAIDFVVGLIEAISEAFKLISFSFRLFGNIFAGEVLLIVISSLVSLLLVLVFLGLEIFVGLIQAFVFFILSLVFFSIATQHHGEHEKH